MGAVAHAAPLKYPAGPRTKRGLVTLSDSRPATAAVPAGVAPQRLLHPARLAAVTDGLRRRARLRRRRSDRIPLRDRLAHRQPRPRGLTQVGRVRPGRRFVIDADANGARSKGIYGSVDWFPVR